MGIIGRGSAAVSGLTAELFYGILDSEQSRSPERLSQLGITLNVTDLPSWELYAYCRDKLYGTSRLSRFWFQQIRPWLAPKKQEEIELAYVDAMAIHKQEYLNAVLERVGQ